MSKFLIVGLGNPGTEYAGTRHNIGFDVAEALAHKHGAVFNAARLADHCEFRWKGKTVVMIKPMTYMNLSGRAVKYWLDKEKIERPNMLVIVDELALPIHKIRLRPAGSDAGHNGLKSIQESLNTDLYPRLRFGIGNDFPKGRQVDHVLGKWTEQELPVVKNKIEKCTEVVESFIVMGLERTMNQYNKLVFIL